MRARGLLTLLLHLGLLTVAQAQTYRESTLVSFLSISNGPVLPAGGLSLMQRGNGWTGVGAHSGRP